MTEEYNDQLRPEQHLTEDYLSMTGMSQTERELLSEYQRLAKNLNQVSIACPIPPCNCQL